MKVCGKCAETKDKESFYNGRASYCKPCYKALYLEKRDHKKELQKAYYEANKDKALRQRSIYREIHKQDRKEKAKVYYQDNKASIKDKNKEYVSSNKDKVKARQKLYRAKNKDKRNEYQNNYIKSRIRTDAVFNFKCRVRSLLHAALKKKKWDKESRTQDVLGCTYDQLYKHLIQTAKDNYNGKYFPCRPYQIDHKIPISVAASKEEAFRLSHYSNLQLLLKQDNLAKSNKLDWTLDSSFDYFTR